MAVTKTIREWAAYHIAKIYLEECERYNINPKDMLDLLKTELEQLQGEAKEVK